MNRYITNLKYDCSVSQCPLARRSFVSPQSEQRVFGGCSEAPSRQGKMSSFYWLSRLTVGGTWGHHLFELTCQRAHRAQDWS